MKIRFLITGGTIDDQIKESHSPTEENTLIPGLLKSARLSVDYVYDILMIKDSSFLTDDDLELILMRCRDSSENHIIITHGTDTMPETAKFLDKHSNGRTIVLTGSFVPANEENSDAPFNVGAAFAAVQTLSPGVYIAMGGQVFNAGNVRKNFEKKIFEEES